MHYLNNHGQYSKFVRVMGLRKQVDTSGYINMRKLRNDFREEVKNLPDAYMENRFIKERVIDFVEEIPALAEYAFKALQKRVDRETVRGVLVELCEKTLKSIQNRNSNAKKYKKK